MSLANVRQHWKFLVKVAAIFLAVIVIGPLAFYAIGALLYYITSPLGSGNLVIVGIAMGLVAIGWMFFVLWLGNRGIKSTEDQTNG